MPVFCNLRLFFVIGLLVASVFPPISFLLCWSKVPRGAAITAALGGQFAAITAWLATTYAVHGQVTIATTAKNGPSLAGNIVAIGVSTVIVVVWTWLRPDNSCSWDDLRDRLRSNVEVCGRMLYWVGVAARSDVCTALCGSNWVWGEHAILSHCTTMSTWHDLHGINWTHSSGIDRIPLISYHTAPIGAVY